MTKKTPEQLTREFEGRKAKGLAKGAAAYWPHVMANTVLRLVAAGGEVSAETLGEALANEAQASDVTLRAGAVEALARLRQAAAKRS